MKKLTIIFFLFIISNFNYGQSDSVNVSPNSCSIQSNFYIYLVNNDTVTITIYDKLGIVVLTPITDSAMSSGNHIVPFYCADFMNEVYYFQMKLSDGSKKNGTFIKNDAVGIENNESKDNLIKIYPNPTYDFIMTNLDGYKKIELITLTGSLSRTIYTDENIVSLSGLNEGIYVINIYNNKGLLFISKRVVKTR